MPLEITGLYAAILIIVQIVLTFRVIGVRFSQKVIIGHGENKTLEKRIRSHGNFTETVPITLIGLALLESQATVPWLLHAIGVVLVLARLLHPVGMENPAKLKLRQAGMILTCTCMVTTSIALIVQFIR